MTLAILTLLRGIARDIKAVGHELELQRKEREERARDFEAGLGDAIEELEDWRKSPSEKED